MYKILVVSLPGSPKRETPYWEMVRLLEERLKLSMPSLELVMLLMSPWLFLETWTWES